MPMTTIPDHPRCELCAEHPAGTHCWTHTYEDGDPDEGRMRCRHCSAVGRVCDKCEGECVLNIWIDDEEDDEVDCVEVDCLTCEGWGVIDETVGTPVVQRRRRAR